MVDRVDDSGSPPPGVKRWLISCDETGFNGARHYGFGALWMPWQRRGDFAGLIRGLRDEHNYPYEIKWQKVKARYVEFYIDLVDVFFDTNWMWFHCLLVERAVVRRELHASMDEAHRKHFVMLLANKVRRSLRAFPTRQQTFRVWVDPMPSSYSKANEAASVILGHIIEKSGSSREVIEGVYPHVSHATPSIQLSDLLLGAVAACREGKAESQAKTEIMAHVASRLGWPSLRHDTLPNERKFNVWVFHDKTRGPRRENTRRTS